MKILKKVFQGIIRFFLKGFTTKVFEDGSCALYLRLPFNFNTKYLFSLFYGCKPIDPRKIVFDNYMGKGYGCNPKYVAEYLCKKYPGKFDIVWIVSDKDKLTGEIPDWIRTVNYSSKKAIEEFATAKVWVSNYHKISFIRRGGLFRRKAQHFIQMWHGSLGIKKIENDASVLTSDKAWLNLAKRSSCMVDYWISNSDFETEIYKRAFWGVQNIYLYGHPRNDILMQDTSQLEKKVKKHFGIEGKKILFYAPTFREDYRLDCYSVNYKMLNSCLEEFFGGEWTILVRMHPRIRKYSSDVIPELPYVHDATYYTDIQELLAAADCMLTDYSSCVFDFMLTRRPAFIFATDIEEYNTERGFYYPLEDTPFPIARSNDELALCIGQFDYKSYKRRVDDFLMSKGCVEDGHASERVVEKIVELTGDVAYKDVDLIKTKASASIRSLFYKRYHKEPLEPKKIVFVNDHGRSFGCNPKYITQVLLGMLDDLDIVWLVDNKNMYVPNGVRTVLYNSEQAIREVSTAPVIVSNCMWLPGFIKRPDQYYIQTCHGYVRLRKVGFDNPSNVYNDKYKKRIIENFASIDLVLSNSDFGDSVYRRALCYNGPILKVGTPRCDILFNTPKSLKQEVCARLNVPSDKKILLYAPAWRNGEYTHTYVLDYARLARDLGDDYMVFVRLHPRLSQIARDFAYGKRVINTTEYPDLHELMAIADILVTDYSNIMFEFASASKPVFLFTPDLETYSKKHAFYFDILSLPFPCVETQQALLEVIKSTDLVAYQKRTRHFFATNVGLNESGNAAQVAAVAIVNKLNLDYIQTVMPDGSIRNNIVQNITPPDILSRLYDMYHAFPLERKKIVFINFHGRGFGCNPKYIAQELLARHKDLDLVWMVRGYADMPQGVRVVPYDSEWAIMEIATAKVLIDNTMMFTGFKKRLDQYYINTWHGAIPLKKIGFDNPQNENSKKYADRNNCNFPYVDLMLSNSSFASAMYRRAMGFKGEILESGYPRNDILLNIPSGLKANVCKYFNISQDTKIILYAPTFRSDKSLNKFTLDYQHILDALGKKYAILIRLHPRQRTQAKALIYTDSIVNASDYPDMQELMAVADFMITDYSNIMFEFALTERPVYLYSPDVEEYRKERDYYFEIFDLPFPVAQTTEQLLECIFSHNHSLYLAKIRKFFDQVGLKESGHAARDTVDRIEDVLELVPSTDEKKAGDFTKIDMNDSDTVQSLFQEFHALPMQGNKIVCCNFNGKGYGCNPKYIVKALLASHKPLDIVWLSSKRNSLPATVRNVPFSSREGIRELATAHVIISNVLNPVGYIKRIGQLYINTWHASIPLKKIGFDNPENREPLGTVKVAYTDRCSATFSNVDLMTSNSRFSTAVYRRAFGYSGEILECGYPRNDVLINAVNRLKVKEKICKKFHIPLEKKIILYAPTYRKHKLTDAFTLDYLHLLSELGSEYVLLLRMHPYMIAASKNLQYTSDFINVSSYPDMQELMAVADIFITDYSNTMFEFAITERPVFIFATDIDEYCKQRDFYFDIYSLPFPVFTTTEDLIFGIKRFDKEQYLKDVNIFMEEKVGVFESGRASRAVARIILQILFGKAHDVKEAINNLKLQY